MHLGHGGGGVDVTDVLGERVVVCMAAAELVCDTTGCRQDAVCRYNPDNPSSAGETIRIEVADDVPAADLPMVIAEAMNRVWRHVLAIAMGGGGATTSAAAVLPRRLVTVAV